MSESDGINPQVPPSGTGCVDCDANGGWWFHLRRCAECGHVGCCDDSLAKHATAHYRETGHPIIQSFEPGESWMYDYSTTEMMPGIELEPPRHHPEDQTAPGPADRLPADWMQQLS